MAITPEKILEYTGITADTDGAFQEAFSKKFLTEDQIFKDETVKSKIFGRAFGSATTAIKQHFDKLGVEITGDDLKQPIEAVVTLGINKLNENFALQRAELEKTAGLTADEKIKEISDNLAKAQAKNKDYEKLVKDKVTEFETLQAQKSAELKQFKLNSVHKDVTSVIPFDPSKDEYSKIGFLTKMGEKYAIDLDENDEPFIFEKATNARIKADGSHSTWMTPADVYKQEAIKAGLASINKKAGQPAIPNKAGNIATNKPATHTPPMTGRRQLANTTFLRGE
jgi:hypothetical protein